MNRGRWWSITSPDGIACGPIRAASPVLALLRLHQEALGSQAVRLDRAGALVFVDPQDAEDYGGEGWRVELCQAKRRQRLQRQP